jgi:hypothetical protein
MKLLGKSKVVKKQAKPEFTYPIVRLPQSEINLAGETAYVFKTEHNGKPVYVISLDEEFDGQFVFDWYYILGIICSYYGGKWSKTTIH